MKELQIVFKTISFQPSKDSQEVSEIAQGRLL